MKYIHQFLIIVFISFLGELLSLLPFPIPASVYGLGIMLFALYTKIIQLEEVEDVANWFILIMPVLFIPSAVSLMNVKEELIAYVVVITIVLFISTIVVMVVTSKTAEHFILKKENKHE